MRKLVNWLFPVLLVSISIFIAFRNYVPGTWLLGWDNLVPELNFKLNIARSLSAVWQEYQGVGLLGGMAHGADLPRQLILWVFSLFVGQSFLRYLWVFLMLLLGPVGVYFLVGSFLRKAENRILIAFAGLTGGIFYIFNLVTLQTFYTPFETFVSFYGFLPWLLFLAVDYLDGGSGKKLFVFALVSFFATSAFYVQTLFIVYAVFLGAVSLESIVRNGKNGIFRCIKIGLVTIFINSFWLFPATYYAISSAAIPGASHINSIATPETQLMNLARANFANISALKGYWFDYFDWSNSGTYDFLYRTWISYVNNFAVTAASIILFTTSVFGLVFSILKKKVHFGASFLLLLVVSYLMLAGMQIPVPFFAESFRNVFTKWGNALSLTISVGLGLFVFVISDIVGGRIKYFYAFLISVVIISGSIFTTYPILERELIADSMRINLPLYYQDTVDYFGSIDTSKRVAAFPLTDFWGWQFNDWGYRGSGFIWYGISQPILSRTFDVWSPKNEDFYSEISEAVNFRDVTGLNYALSKYQVGYILFDGSIFMPGDPSSASKIQAQRAFLESSGLISFDRQFGKIIVYKVNVDANSFVSAPKIDYTDPYVVLGETGPVNVKESFSDSQGYSQAKNCNLKGLGTVITEKRDGGDYYEAEGDGVSCDYFYYPMLDSSKAYLMRITGKNLSGRSLKFYLYNVAREMMVSEELLPKGDFDKSYYILPVSRQDEGGGYTLNVETRSFGNIKSENLITGIEFYPVDFSYSSPKQILNNLQINNVQKFGTWAYKVDVQGSGLIQLGQGYEKGWIGFRIIGSDVQILDNRIFSDWSNSWIVPEGPDKSTVYIFFWPQLLEWGGGIVGIILLITVLGWGPAALQPHGRSTG